MKQGSIDLLPDAIRARSQAGVVAGRYVASLLIGVVLLGLTATHSRLMLDLARQRLEVAEEQADLVLAAEAKAEQLLASLTETRGLISRYEIIATPLDVSRLIATIVNRLPTSATIERLDLFSGTRRAHRSARSRSAKPDATRSRILTGELSGFAASDLDIAEIVANLESLNVFQQVSLDFSRTKTVRNLSAREFRISFRVDLNVAYEVDDLPSSEMTAAEG